MGDREIHFCFDGLDGFHCECFVVLEIERRKQKENQGHDSVRDREAVVFYTNDTMIYVSISGTEILVCIQF